MVELLVRLYLMITIICLLTNFDVSILLSAFAMWDYNRINKRKEALCRERGINEDRKEEFRNMGDQSPLFRYTL